MSKRPEGDDRNATVVKFPSEPDIERQKAEAERLAGLSEPDWRFQLKRSAERIGTPVADLRAAVNAIIRERKEQQRAIDAKNQRRERKHELAERDTERERKEAERKQE